MLIRSFIRKHSKGRSFLKNKHGNILHGLSFKGVDKTRIKIIYEKTFIYF